MAHNGGTTQLNPWFLQHGGCYLFKNALLGGNDWNNVGAGYDQTKHDSNGYMHTKYGTNIYSRCYLPEQADRPGNWILKWDGGGNVGLGGSGDTTGRIVYSGVGGLVDVTVNTITSDGVDYPHNIRLVHADDEAALATDPYAFNDHVLNLLIDAKVGCLRFLDWPNANTTNIVRWADRHPLTYFSYAAKNRQIIPTTTGVMTNSGDDYTVAHTGFTLTDMKQITVIWNANCSGNAPTIDIEGTGRKAIRQASGDWQLNTIRDSRKPVAGVQSTLTYSQTLDCYMLNGYFGGEYHGIEAAVPYEILVKLCNEVGAHPWFIIPQNAADPFSDLTTELATYCKNNLASGLIPRFEPPNECWNSIFNSTNYAWAMEKAKGYGNFDTNPWYGRALSKIGKAVSDVYADDRSKYWVVCSYQTTGSISSIDERLGATRYIAEGGTAAHLWTTHTSGAIYWGPTIQGTLDLGTWATSTAYAVANVVLRSGVYYYCRNSHTSDSAKAPGTGANWTSYWYVYPPGTVTEGSLATSWLAAATQDEKEVLLEQYLREEGGPYYGEDFEDLLALMVQFYERADLIAVLGRTGYEGGANIGRTGGEANSALFRAAAHKARYMHNLTHKRHMQFQLEGGEFMPQYVFTGRESYSIFYEDEYATPASSWPAKSDWSHGLRRFRAQAS